MQKGTLHSEGFSPYQAIDEPRFYECDRYGDVRLSNRLLALKERVLDRKSVVIQQLADKLSEREAWYRLLKHPKLRIGKMLSDLLESSCGWEESSHLLLLEDTTQLTYNHLRDKLVDPSGLGGTYAYNSRYYGYLMHLTIGIDAVADFPVGIADVQYWHKAAGMEGYDQRKGASLPIEKKSSYRWISAALAGAKRIGPSIAKTVIADRESDIYEAFCQWQAAGLDFIVRSQFDRKITASAGKLRAYLDQMPAKGEYELSIESDKRSGQTSRMARMELRFGPITLERGYKAKSSRIQDYPKELDLYVLEAKEISLTTKPIVWRLLSSHPIDSVQAAKQVLEWYQKRWHIEQFFRILKNKGLQLETLKYEQGLSILRMGTIALEAAFRILQLNLAMKSETELPITRFFSIRQKAILLLLSRRYEGNTPKSKNPYPHTNLKWAGWTIARMGGWKGYNTQARPGPITFARGWAQFKQAEQTLELLNLEIDMEEG